MAFGIGAAQFLQQRLNLDLSNNWEDILTNPPPTLEANSFTNAPNTNNASFYRIRAVR